MAIQDFLQGLNTTFLMRSNSQANEVVFICCLPLIIKRAFDVPVLTLIYECYKLVFCQFYL